MSEFFVSGKTASCIKEMYRKTEAEKRIRLLEKGGPRSSRQPLLSLY